MQARLKVRVNIGQDFFVTTFNASNSVRDTYSAIEEEAVTILDRKISVRYLRGPEGALGAGAVLGDVLAANDEVTVVEGVRPVQKSPETTPKRRGQSDTNPRPRKKATPATVKGKEKINDDSTTEEASKPRDCATCHHSLPQGLSRHTVVEKRKICKHCPKGICRACPHFESCKRFRFAKRPHGIDGEDLRAYLDVMDMDDKKACEDYLNKMKIKEGKKKKQRASRKELFAIWSETRLKELHEQGKIGVEATALMLREWAVATDNPDAKGEKETDGHNLGLLIEEMDSVPRITDGSEGDEGQLSLTVPCGIDIPSSQESENQLLVEDSEKEKHDDLESESEKN